MRSVIRVGATTAIVGGIALYVLARTSGLVAALGVVVLGVIVGLAMAKWLEWGWYGRQLEAGAQAGAIACLPAAALGLVALLSQGPRSVAGLETASHLGPVNAAGLAHAFGFAGWAGADLLGMVFGTCFAIGAAALSAIVMGWSKSGRAIKTVSQAYEAARSLRSGTWNPSAATAMTTAIPALQSPMSSTSAWQAAPHQLASSPANTRESRAASKRGSAPEMPLPANTPANETELRAAMREALAMWGDESGEHDGVAADSGVHADASQPDQPTEQRKRKSQASQFLNDAKKRGRKKSDTRDWLC